MTHIAKVVELIGGSEKGWSEAAQAALDEAKMTIKGITGLEVSDITAKVDPGTGKITGLEVSDITAKVDPGTGKITEYKVGVNIAFGVEHT